MTTETLVYEIEVDDVMYNVSFLVDFLIHGSNHPAHYDNWTGWSPPESAALEITGITVASAWPECSPEYALANFIPWAERHIDIIEQRCWDEAEERFIDE